MDATDNCARRGVGDHDHFHSKFADMAALSERPSEAVSHPQGREEAIEGQRPSSARSIDREARSL